MPATEISAISLPTFVQTNNQIKGAERLDRIQEADDTENSNPSEKNPGKGAKKQDKKIRGREQTGRASKNPAPEIATFQFKRSREGKIFAVTGQTDNIRGESIQEKTIQKIRTVIRVNGEPVNPPQKGQILDILA